MLPPQGKALALSIGLAPGTFRFRNQRLHENASPERKCVRKRLGDRNSCEKPFPEPKPERPADSRKKFRPKKAVRERNSARKSAPVTEMCPKKGLRTEILSENALRERHPCEKSVSGTKFGTKSWIANENPSEKALQEQKFPRKSVPRAEICPKSASEAKFGPKIRFGSEILLENVVFKHDPAK